MKGLDASAENRGIAGEALHGVALVAQTLDEAVGATGRDESHAVVIEMLKYRFKTVFVVDGD